MLREGKLEFTFPDEWEVTKYDAWSYYQNQFKGCCCGNKAVDFLAIDRERNLWLIEVKDYREHVRTKTEELWNQVAIKVRDTLAGLYAAKIDKAHVNNPYAGIALTTSKFKVVLHLEQPVQHSKIFPRKFISANVQNKIKQLIKPIDAHPKVIESSQMRGVAWSVRSLGENHETLA
jgi:hypothetical protein